MDVTRLLSELRSEREDIEQAILSLERFDRLRNGTADSALNCVAEIRRVRETDEFLRRPKSAESPNLRNPVRNASEDD